MTRRTYPQLPVIAQAAAEMMTFGAHFMPDVTRLDAEIQTGNAPAERLNDIPSDATAGEVVSVPPAVMISAIAAPTTLRMRLLAVDDAGERLIGEYRFNHSPYSA